MIQTAQARPASGTRVTVRPRGVLLIVCLAAALALWGCAKPAPPPPPPPPPPPALEQPLSQEEALDRVRQMHPSTQGLKSWEELRPGLKANLAYVSSRPAGGVAVKRPGLRLTWGALRQTLEELLAALPYLDEDPELLARLFAWFPLEKETLVTGYYEPLLEASLVPDKDYPYAIFGPPQDLLTVDLGEFHPRWKGQKLHYRMTKNGIKPYYGRGDIDFGDALSEKGAEIAWVKDRVDLYFLHIQGSGRLLLPDGSVKHVLYAEKNGRELTMLGRTVIARGYLTRDEASAPRIRKFVKDHPKLERDLLSTDKSYVFFRLSDHGPFGSMGSQLTPMASIAVDRSQVPLGAALALSVALPVPRSGGPSRLAGVMLAQDTGGAILGSHVDLFCGAGPYAEFVSGRMKNAGALSLLVSRRVLAGLRGETAGNGGAAEAPAQGQEGQNGNGAPGPANGGHLGQ